MTSHNPVDLEIEELSDFDPMDSDREGALKPTAYEDADSERSRPSSRCGRNRKSGSRFGGLVSSMQNLDCGNDSDDEFNADEAELHEFMMWQKELKRRNRISRGSSIGKRTISERGDSDHEDLKPFENGECPIDHRRMKRRLGERRESIFHDHPPERIPEVEEPNSDEEEQVFNFARELPYFEIEEIMEVDSD